MNKHIKNILISVRYIYVRYLKNRYFSSVEIYSLSEVCLHKCLKSEVSFFGYYNISPKNNKGKLLACMPNGDFINIICKDGDNERTIGVSESFNLQQGCMLQWGGVDNDNVYYNIFDRVKKQYASVVYSEINEQIINSYSMPLYCIDKNGEYALTLNFERLSLLRPDYGYFCMEPSALANNDYDGIWYIDIHTKEVKLIISLTQLINLKEVPSMRGAVHKVNHIDISPDGKRFMFLHRWQGPLGRYTRLITADSNGKNLYILNGDIMTSHSCWRANNIIISFCNTEEFGNAYVIFEDKTSNKRILSYKLPSVDGHPSVSPDKRWLITDTYPDLGRMSRLILYDMVNDNVIVLGRFYQPLKYLKSNRIDLHPKWSPSGCEIYFESGHNGLRNLYSLDISMLLI